MHNGSTSSEPLFDEKANEYKIRDLELHDLGRKEIENAQVEMPGLMACRNKFGPSKPLNGAKITGSLHMTIQTAVLIETLETLGATIRWCSCNIFSTQDHAAAAIVKSTSASVFAWKGETLEEYWWCTEQALTWDKNGTGPDLIVDDGGDATLLIHEGVKAERVYEESKTLPDVGSATNDDMRAVYSLLKNSILQNPKKWTNIAINCFGVSEETTTGAARLQQMELSGELLFSAINVNDSVTKSKFDNIYGCRHSLLDGILRATDVMVAGKLVLICGFGDVGKGCAASMKGAGARVLVSEVDPICALQACMEGYSVVLLKEVIDKVDIVVTATGNVDIVMASDMRRMKHNAIVCNIGHFDNEVDISGLLKIKGLRHIPIKPQVDQYIFPDTKNGIIVLASGRLVNLGCATGHPSFVMSTSFTNQVLAQIDLWEKHKENANNKPKVYVLPKLLDEQVARLHLEKLDAKLTVLSKKQADHIGVKIKGPFKNHAYRY